MSWTTTTGATHSPYVTHIQQNPEPTLVESPSAARKNRQDFLFMYIFSSLTNFQTNKEKSAQEPCKIVLTTLPSRS